MIIGITGYKGVGKDVAAQVFTNMGFVHYKFANALKQALKILFLWDDQYIEGPLKETIDERWGISPRQAMQFFGTEIGRELLPKTFPLFKEKNGDNYWVRYFKYWREQFKYQEVNIVVSDVRFPNEVDSIREMGGVILRISRPSVINNDPHVSEKFIKQIDPEYEIANMHSLEEFIQQVKCVYSLILSWKCV